MYHKNNELYHWGILGQKWGVRRYQNPDGTLTSAGRERYKVSQRQLDKASKILKENGTGNDNSNELFKTLKIDSKKRDLAINEMKQLVNENSEIAKSARKLLKGLENEDSYYEVTSALAYRMKDKPDSAGKYTLDDLGRIAWNAVHDDGGDEDNTVNKRSVYAYDKGITGEVNDLFTKYDNNQMKRKKAAQDYINEALKEVGAEKIRNLWHDKDSDKAYYEDVGKKVVTNKVYHDTNKAGYNYAIYDLDDAVGARDLTDKNKKAIKTAKSWVDKVPSDQGTWWVFNKAVENLGMSSFKLNNLSQSDWNRLNKEISKLKEENSIASRLSDVK